MLYIALSALAALAPQDDHGYAAKALTLEDGSRFAYRLLPPAEPVAGRSYPLLVFLHGAGERGSDNLAQLAHLPEHLATPEYRALFDGFVLAPQCRANQRWVETDWSAETSTPMTEEPSPMLAAALRALDAVVAEHPIDVERVFLTGLSMGGYGAWELALRQPERFAAVVPICGGGDERLAARLAALPLWAWHGDQDRAVPVRRSRDMLLAIRAAGGAPRYTELAGVGHFAWPEAYAVDSPLWPWLAAQRRGLPDPTLDGRPAAEPLVLERSSPAVVELALNRRLASVTFAADLDGSRKLLGRGITLPDGGEVRYERGAVVANQTLESFLVLEGDAVLRNDNDWTHFADTLRFVHPFAGSGTVTIRGDGLGGVELPRECYGSFRGRFVVESGRLIISHWWISGEQHPIELRGGDVFLRGGFETREDFHITGAASITVGSEATLRGALTIEAGARCVLDTGGGNQVRLGGPLAGAGTLAVRGAADHRPGRPTTCASEGAPFAGVLHVERGTLRLANPAPDVFGDVVLGGEGRGCLVIERDAQLRDDALLTVLDGWIEQRTGAETYGVLDLRGDLALDLAADDADGPRALARTACFTVSAAHPPASGAQLVVRGFLPGVDRVVLAAAGPVDWAACLPRVGIRAGGVLHHARRAADGALELGAAVAPRGAFELVDPARAALHAAGGLARLAAPDSPLTDDTVISLFGDSITWQDAWPSAIERALREDAGSRARVHNRGINGGGVLEVLGGSPDSARRGAQGNAPQAPFADVLAADDTTLAVVFIGINDLWWRGTSEARYEEALTEVVRLAHAAGVRVVLATPWLLQELPDGSGPQDELLERFADIVRRVAVARDVTLVDLRAAALAWLMDNNTELRLDGSYEHRAQGLLTYDGVHPSAAGNALLADWLADGVRRALER
jgi:lysophospholipase L1-like esterase/dienelactone hydrolase